jgi:LuxR family maltose regulon positive regulatory protein
MRFITTKLIAPAPRRNYIVRQELYNKLNCLDQCKVVVINGAPGSGKTTLITAFLKDNPAIKKVTRWISLDEENNNLFSFWFYFLEAVKDLLGEQGEDIVSMFHGIVQKQDLEQILIILINQLQDSGEIAVVLDDFHHIRDELILDTVSFFVKHSSDNVRLIILTREEPKLYMGDLLISGRLLEINEEDLKLSHQERLEFLKKTLSYNLDKDTADKMAALSEGWVGGLQLLALAMHKKQPDLLKNIKALNKYMVEYLSNEIIKSVDEDVKDFLIKTSILSHFDHKLCNSLLGINNSGEIIQTLLEKSLFIVTIDEDAEVYRYHNIFREFLRFHFSLLPDENRVELHLKAALLYEEAGDLEDSIIHLLEINSFTKALENIHKMKHSATAWHYLKRIPVQYINDNPDLLFQRLFYHFCNMELDECNKIADQLEDRDSNLSWRVFRLIKAMVDDDGFEVDLGLELLQDIEEMNFSEATKAVMYLNIAILLCVQDEFSDGIKYLESAFLMNQKVNNPYIEYFLLNYKSQIKEAMGDLEECKELYERVFKLIEKYPFLEPLKGFSLLGDAGVHLHQLELPRAEECLNSVKDLLSNTYKSLERGYHYNLMELKALSGAKEDAARRCNDLFQLDVYQNDVYISSLLSYQLFLNQVDQDKAEEFMKLYEGKQAGELRFDDKLAYAQLLSLKGEGKVALEILEDLLITGRKDKVKFYFVKALLTKVSILANHGDDKMKEILNLLREAIHYSYQNGIRSPYKLAGDQILKYLKLLMSDRGKDLNVKENSFLCDLLLRLEEKKRSGDLLSDREIEVLEVLATGASNKEIAESLYISISTVKTHIINIYSKLQVSNRIEAIEKGREKGII